MASSAAAAPTLTSTAPLPLDAAPFLVAEVGGSKQTQYDLHELTNAFVAGQITALYALVYRGLSETSSTRDCHGQGGGGRRRSAT